MSRAIKRSADGIDPRTSEDVSRSRGGVQVRLLKCDTCAAVWPTEREPEHGGSRSDGEPCAYCWPDGRVCEGTVRPLGGYYPREEWPARGEKPRPPPVRRAYGGEWCAVLGVPWGTTDLAVVRRAYRAAIFKAHPDRGGTEAETVALNVAYRLALAELGQPT